MKLFKITFKQFDEEGNSSIRMLHVAADDRLSAEHKFWESYQDDNIRVLSVYETGPTQKTVLVLIREYMKRIGVDIIRVEYGSMRTVRVVTAPGLYVFGYSNEFHLIQEP